ncbi:ABC transporter ATP-binding protein [Rossellomorea marisflavi]|uniref:ABC transporter ATP-binding protein n=1 Tax=Rossellomorea marisflavi TaxID=189381 RepID=UPI00351879F0
MYNIYKSFGIILKVNKLSFLLLGISKIIQGFIPFVTLTVLQKLINSVELYLKNETAISYIIILLSIQISLTIFSNFQIKLEEYLSSVIQMNTELHLKAKLSLKLMNVSYQKLEDPEFHNLIQRTQGDIGSQFLNPINSFLDLVKSAITLFSVLYFLMKFHYGFFIIFLLFGLPLFIMQYRFGQNRYWLTKYLTPDAREQGYIFGLFTERQYNKEIRINQSFKFLFTKWKRSYENNRNAYLKQQRLQSVKLLLLDIVNSLAFVASFLLIISLLIQSKVRIGDFVSIVEATQRSLGTISGLSYVISNLKESTQFLGDVFTILAVPESRGRKEPYESSVDFILDVENLSFTYPNTTNPALNNISLKVCQGETIMVVGSNGSGKSTLVKCISGLYKIEQGGMKLWGEDVNNLSHDFIAKKIALVPQDFGKYEFTAEENILLGSVMNKQKRNIKEAAEKSGIHNYINSLPKGYETRLGRLFSESEDLSGGQWQKLALARALIKEAELYILDEPTSSLDPIAERDLFLKFKEITKNRTSIFISHRMYACHLADRIIVMDKGEIIEQGSHNELFKLKGVYYEMYLNQSKMYKEGNEEFEWII